MKRFTIYIFLIVISLSLLASCDKVLDFDYHDVESQIVIEARTTQEGTSVLITRTCPMGKPMVVSPVIDAEVILRDLTDSSVSVLAADTAGVFLDSIPGLTGHNYEIEVNQQGRRYVASSVMRPAAPVLNLDFQWIKMPYDHVAVLRISFKDPSPDEDCFWIRIYKNGTPYKWLLSDDRGAQNGVIIESTMTSRMDLDEEDEKSMLEDGDAVEVVIAPIAREMYDYLNAIQSDSNGPRMFSGDFCLGYYYSGAESRSTIIFHPSEMNFFN